MKILKKYLNISENITTYGIVKTQRKQAIPNCTNLDEAEDLSYSVVPCEEAVPLGKDPKHYLLPIRIHNNKKACVCSNTVIQLNKPQHGRKPFCVLKMLVCIHPQALLLLGGLSRETFLIE